MKAYLKPIKIHEGCFSGEKGVVITDYNGERLSGFFDNGFIKNGRLEVEVCAEEEDGVLIFTPQEGVLDDRNFYGAMHQLWVKKSDLEYI